MNLPTPTVSLVRTYITQFDESQDVLENALTKLFQFLPSNEKIEDVLLKAVTLNQLYATGILAIYRVAEHIHSLKIDEAVSSGESEIVHKIARVEIKGKERYNYSFATKYCAWHHPDKYPIYDRFVEQILWDYKKKDGFVVYNRLDLWNNYQTFRDVVIAFRDSYGLSEFSLKEIDKFLWGLGKDIYK